MKIVAHRGESQSYPENTMAAFRAAVKSGAACIETDIHLTADKQLVCFHDHDLVRLCNRTDTIESMTAAQLTQCDVGSWKGKEFLGETIPLIDDLFSITYGGEYFLEIKCGKEAVSLLRDRVRARAISEERITIISFYDGVIAEVKSMWPNVRTQLLIDTRLYRDAYKKTFDSICERVALCRADGVGLSYQPGQHHTLLRNCKKCGLIVNVWTIDDVEIAQNLADSGIDYLTPNSAGVMQSSLTLR